MTDEWTDDDYLAVGSQFSEYWLIDRLVECDSIAKMMMGGRIADTSADRDNELERKVLPKKLHDLADKAIAQGRTQQAIDVLEPIVHPPETDAERGRGNLNKQFRN